MNDTAILEAKALRRVYQRSDGESTEILKGIDLEIRKGEFAAVMGQSGSGKSTLLYCISGMDRISGGSVVYDGRELRTLSDDEISRIRLTSMGFVFQQSYMLGDFTIKENIMLPALKAGKISKKQAERRALESMERVGIAHVADSDITQVSGGAVTARRNMPCAHKSARRAVCRRAHGCAEFGRHRGDHGDIRAGERRGDDHRHGDARCEGRRPCGQGDLS